MSRFDLIKKEIERNIDLEKLLFDLEDILCNAPVKEECLDIENDIFNTIEILIKNLKFYLYGGGELWKN